MSEKSKPEGHEAREYWDASLQEGQQEGPSPETAEMYRLPGDPPLTEKDFDRYRRSKRIPETVSAEAVEKYLWDSAWHVRQMAVLQIKFAPLKDRVSLMQEVMSDASGDVRLEAIYEVESLPLGSRGSMVLKALKDEYYRVREAGGRKLAALTTEEKKSVAEHLFSDSNSSLDALEFFVMHLDAFPTEDQKTYLKRAWTHAEGMIRNAALHQLSLLPESERTEMALNAVDDPVDYVRSTVFCLGIDQLSEMGRARVVELGLNSPYEETVALAVKSIALTSVQDQPKLLSQIPASRSLQVEEAVLSIVELLPKKERSGMIKFGLEHHVMVMRSEAARQIGFLPIRERAQVIESILQYTRDPIMETGAVQNIRTVPMDERARLVSLALNSPVVETRLMCIAEIEFTLPDDWLELARIALDDSSPQVRGEVIKRLEFLVPQEEWLNWIDKGLEDMDRKVRERTASKMSLIPRDDPKWDTFIEKYTRMQNSYFQFVATHTDLYKNHHERFGRANQLKSGTKTTLLDRVPGQDKTTLRDRAMIRHIPPSALSSWRTAYESSHMWQELGFHYVPIEPIVDTKPLKKDELFVDVASRVLMGPSVADWLEKYGLFEMEIRNLMKLILEGLNRLGVVHGHPHDEFCRGV